MPDWLFEETKEYRFNLDEECERRSSGRCRIKINSLGYFFYEIF